jgi:hypothetical protein
MLRRNAIGLGVAIGLLFPAMAFGMLYAAGQFIDPVSRYARFFAVPTLLITSIFLNLVPVRIYFVNLKADKTGRGILLVTFILVFVYFLVLRRF